MPPPTLERLRQEKLQNVDARNYVMVYEEDLQALLVCLQHDGASEEEIDAIMMECATDLQADR